MMKAAPSKTPGKRGAVINLYHVEPLSYSSHFCSNVSIQSLIREHLHHKCILGHHDKILLSPEASEVEDFVNDNQGGPSLEVPCFYWAESFESTWNQQVLFILATDLCPRLLESEIGGQLEAKWTSIVALKKTIAIKLKRTCKDYNMHTSPPINSQEMAVEKVAWFSQRKDTILKQNRRNGCCKGVSDNYQLFLIPR